MFKRFKIVFSGNTSSTGSMTSEFVRQELRAIVGARTQQQQQRVPNNLQNNLTGQVSQDDLDALGLTFEMSTAGRFNLFYFLLCKFYYITFSILILCCKISFFKMLHVGNSGRNDALEDNIASIGKILMDF